VDSPDGAQMIESGFFDWLQQDLADHACDTSGLPFGFSLGWVGYLGYELKAECGGARAHRSADPDAFLIFVDRGLVFDHQAGEVYLLALAPAGDESAARGWLDRTATRLGELAATQPGELVVPRIGVRDVRLRHDRDSYLRMIEACLMAIRQGES